MPSLALLQIERGLAELDCPHKQLRRRIQELAEHHDDLKRDALEEGLSEADAEARADKLLGEPAALAGHLAAALRQSSWWGRHPVIGFCLLPPLAIFLLFFICLWFDYFICNLWLTEDQISDLANGGRELRFCRWLVAGNYYASIILTAALFSTLARRTVRGIKWAAIVCVVCALHGVFFHISLVPHNFTVGYSNRIHWPGTLIPLIVAFAFWLRLRRATNGLAPLPAGLRLRRINSSPLPKLHRSRIVTPTSTITCLLLAAIISFALYAYCQTRLHNPAPAKHVALPAQ